MSVNEVHPFLFELCKKGIHDQNPYVRRVALTALLKVKSPLKLNIGLIDLRTDRNGLERPYR
jgi:hypothetical protein